VFYKWRGYSGRIDVELFAEHVPFPYGKPPNVQHPDYISSAVLPYGYDSMDHCQFDTHKEVITTCMPVGNETTNAMQECVDLMERDFASGSRTSGAVLSQLNFDRWDLKQNEYELTEITDAGKYGTTRRETQNWFRKQNMDENTYIHSNNNEHQINVLDSSDGWGMGIEGTLIQNPSNTFQNIAPHIPWDDSTCAVQSPLLTLNDGLEGVVVRRSDALTEANIRDVSMFRGIIESKDKQCTHLHRTYSGFPQLNDYFAKMTLRNAMAKCAEMAEACQGVQVALLETTSREEIGRNESVLISVSFCKRSTVRNSNSIQTAGKITFIKNKQHLHHLHRYQFNIMKTDGFGEKPSFPGYRDGGGGVEGSGIGHEQLVKIGSTIKSRFNLFL